MKLDLPKITKMSKFDDLRTEHGADMVQLIGYYKDACGAG